MKDQSGLAGRRSSKRHHRENQNPGEHLPDDPDPQIQNAGQYYVPGVKNQLLSSDPCLEGYLAFLSSEIGPMSDDAVGRRHYYFACAVYAEFTRSSSPETRRRTWAAVQTACKWLSRRQVDILGRKSRSNRRNCL